ncbi:hypothetical protein CAEBREN_07714 [Caenorhabditis brenneri]|uniref:Uncharacterized protein n=1 Tax=Caenorhabditis brenneri TaxID=135651 RepID=G0MM83_CAEBE|nr:hypothetical protein CAEBREN_07714 [Caenorhabditis brenneri]
MRPILLLLLVSLAATSLGYIPVDPEYTNPDQFTDIYPTTDQAWRIAEEWQAMFNKFVLDGQESRMRGLFTKDFVYEACDGTRMGWVDYVEVGIGAPYPRTVYAARADKNHVIFKVKFDNRLQEIMITSKYPDTHIFKAEKAQGLIC